MPLPITLAMFATTKGHYDHKHIYKSTIDDLSKQLNGLYGTFESCIVHIKRETGDDEVFDEMYNYFMEKGFHVAVTFGNWKHYDMSHYLEHARDINTLMTTQVVQKNQFVFWLEDDFLIRTKGNLYNYFEKAVQILQSRPNTLNVRFLKDANDELALGKEKDLGDAYTHKDVFSFNPCVCRSRDVGYLAKVFDTHYKNNTHIHIERFATEAIKGLSNVIDPFCCFKLEEAKAVHIGVQEYSEEFVKGL